MSGAVTALDFALFNFYLTKIRRLRNAYLPPENKQTGDHNLRKSYLPRFLQCAATTATGRLRKLHFENTLLQ